MPAIQSIKASGNSARNEEILIPLLVRRSCHLPGHSWMGDWVQYMKNNHVLFGICLRHPLHPVESWERILGLVGSVSFGLAATTCAFLYDRFDPAAMDEKVFGIWNDEYVVTNGDIVLWTMGGLLHSIFDIVMWHVMACACCHPGGKWGNAPFSERFKDCGSYLMIPVVLALVALASWAVLVRASHDDIGDDEFSVYDDFSASLGNIDGLQSFSFLTDYAVELGLAYFVYFPMVGTLLFSGVLGCNGRLPILGGRPRDKRMIEEGKIGGTGQTRYAAF